MNYITTKYDYALALLEDIVRRERPTQTYLIICSTKEDFIGQIIPALQRHAAVPTATTPQVFEEDDSQHGEIGGTRHIHGLLSPVLHILNASSLVNLNFCPTIPTLRGFLSSDVPKPGPASSSKSPSLPAHQIIILNLLQLHHGSSDFTLQGHSQTFATAASAAHRTNRCLKLVECKDINDPTNPNRGSALWHADVPLLSGSIKIGEGGASWGRRTISVLNVASRWFKEQDEAKKGGGTTRCNRTADFGDEVLV